MKELKPVAMPEAASCVVEIEAPEGGPRQSKKKPHPCLRWFAVCVAMPLLVILSIIGWIVWALLLPLKVSVRAHRSIASDRL